MTQVLGPCTRPSLQWGFGHRSEAGARPCPEAGVRMTEMNVGRAPSCLRCLLKVQVLFLLHELISRHHGPVEWVPSLSHFTEEETEAYRGWVSC